MGSSVQKIFTDLNFLKYIVKNIEFKEKANNNDVNVTIYFENPNVIDAAQKCLSDYGEVIKPFEGNSKMATTTVTCGKESPMLYLLKMTQDGVRTKGNQEKIAQLEVECNSLKSKWNSVSEQMRMMMFTTLPYVRHGLGSRKVEALKQEIHKINNFVKQNNQNSK